MYAIGNPKTKRELREWVASGRRVAIFSTGPFPATANGREVIEGPHGVHRWYADCDIADGVIVKVR